MLDVLYKHCYYYFLGICFCVYVNLYYYKLYLLFTVTCGIEESSHLQVHYDREVCYNPHISTQFRVVVVAIMTS